MHGEPSLQWLHLLVEQHLWSFIRRLETLEQGVKYVQRHQATPLAFNAIVNFDHILHFVLVFLLLTLNM